MFRSFLLILFFYLKNADCEKFNYLKSNLTDEVNSNERIISNNKYDYTNSIATNYVWTTVPIVFLILGTISNILSIIVFLRHEMRKYSSFVYFAILNIVNLVLCYVTFLRIIMEFNFKIDIRTINLIGCKLHVFLTYFLGHLSSLILSTISIDRVISVIFLHQAKFLCTPKKALFVTAVLVLFNFLLSSHFLFCESGYINDENHTNMSNNKEFNVICEPRRGTHYTLFIDKAWKIIDMIMFAFIPFIIMTICSIIIIIRVAQQSKKFQTNKNREKKSLLGKERLNNKHPEFLNEKTVSTCITAVQNQTRVSVTSAGDSINVVLAARRVNRETKFSSRTRNLALMLIPVNLLFLIFLAPVVILMYIYSDLGEDKLTLAIVELLALCNLTFNFIIYFLTSSKFREEFYKIFREILHSFNKNDNALRKTSVKM